MTILFRSGKRQVEKESPSGGADLVFRSTIEIFILWPGRLWRDPRPPAPEFRVLPFWRIQLGVRTTSQHKLSREDKTRTGDETLIGRSSLFESFLINCFQRRELIFSCLVSRKGIPITLHSDFLPLWVNILTCHH